MENKFKRRLENFIVAIGKLQTKFGLEGKLMLNQSMTPVPLNDGSVRVFPPGFHLGNLTEAEERMMDMALKKWVVYANLCMEKNDSITKEFADKMEAVYNFLALRYRPFLNVLPDGGINVRYAQSQSQINVEKMHERFNEYSGMPWVETTGEVADSKEAKEGRETITEQELNAYAGEETDALKKGSDIEKALIVEQRGKQKERQAQLDKLKKEVIENYSNENAGKLYELLGDCGGFWQIVKRGIEKRRRDV